MDQRIAMDTLNRACHTNGGGFRRVKISRMPNKRAKSLALGKNRVAHGFISAHGCRALPKVYPALCSLARLHVATALKAGHVFALFFVQRLRNRTAVGNFFDPHLRVAQFFIAIGATDCRADKSQWRLQAQHHRAPDARQWFPVQPAPPRNSAREYLPQSGFSVICTCSPYARLGGGIIIHAIIIQMHIYQLAMHQTHQMREAFTGCHEICVGGNFAFEKG